MDKSHYVIVVGASAGGLSALKQFVSQLNKELPASVVIVLHLSVYNREDFVVKQLRPHTSLPVQSVAQKTKLKSGVIYIASPNRHLIIKNDEVFTGQGAKENGWRPSIDVLFRS